jgi:glycogen debranching enzyme
VEDETDKYIKVRGIYKDIVGCSLPRCDYQLRPNACIAIALAPELFSKENALSHLKITEERLLEPNSIGIKTLDKGAIEYISFYDNSNDSN